MLPAAPGTLAWGREGEILRCPWHGFEFEMATGARPFVESRMRLRVYPARIEDGEISSISARNARRPEHCARRTPHEHRGTRQRGLRAKDDPGLTIVDCDVHPVVAGGLAPLYPVHAARPGPSASS